MKKLLSVVIMISMSAISAAEYRVDAGNNGIRAFDEALAKARPGDVIRILPVGRPISGSLVIENKSGEPGNPIIIDAMFNTFIGTRPADPAEWRQVEPGLYHAERAWEYGRIARFNLIFDGRMQRMGRTVKWKPRPYKKVSELRDYEWTVIGSKDFYFRIPAGSTLAGVREPIETDSGVMLIGSSSHIIVRNMIAKNFWNDGFNIHFDCKDILFENIAAIDNFDDGISAHENCEITVRNMYARGNATGICHVQDAVATHENVYIAPGIFSADIYLLNKRNILRNVVAAGTSPRGIEFAGGSDNLLESCILAGGRFVTGAQARVRTVATAINAPGPGQSAAELKEHLRKIFGGSLSARDFD